MKIIINKRNIVFTIVIALIFLAIPVYSYSSEIIGKINTIIPDNVYINDQPVGDQKLVEVEKYIDEKIQNQLKSKLTIQFKDGENLQELIFSLEELGFTSNRDKIKADLAAILTNDMNLINKYKNYRKIEAQGRKFEIQYSMNSEVLLKLLEGFDDASLKQPVNASYAYDKGQVIIIGGNNGFRFNKERLIDEIQNKAIQENQSIFELTLAEKEPQITVEDLQSQGIKEKVGSFTTTFTSSNIPRSANIRLATSMIDGTILAPGDVFSFNEVVGKRTKERGFKEAGIYVNGKVDTGVGGGICQVSTTLYNSVLLSDFEVIERGNHSLTVPYVPLSRDAVVNWGTQDFKFRNNTDHYIYIHGVTTGNSVSFDLFSTKTDKRVELISTTLEKKEPTTNYEKDDSLELGKELVVDHGHIGYKSQLTKKVYKGDQLISTKIVSVDRYLSAPRIIKTGTKIAEEIMAQ